MKKLFFGAFILALAIVVSIPAIAGAMGRGGVNVSIGLPPPIEFAGPPEMIVLPETYVYVVPDLDVDIFFYNGWWWRPWQGRWYRSQYYNTGWGYYQSVPSFYSEIPSGWRNDYRNHRWRGHRWNYQRIPHHQVERNWGSWEKSRHWENQQTWGVEGLRSRTQSQQQHQDTGPQSREGQPQRSQQQQKTYEKKGVEQQHQDTGPQSREGQPQRSQQQQGNHDKKDVDKKDVDKEDVDKEDRR